MKNIFYVYQYRKPDSSWPFYIGKGCNNRWMSHLKETKETTDNFFKWSQIENLRRQNKFPIIEKIYTSLDETTAYWFETFLIKLYGRKGIESEGILTNRCLDNHPPNKKGVPKSLETRQKISKAKLGTKLIFTETWCRNISLARLGAKNKRAKKWEFIDPTGYKYIVTGTFDVFCKQHNLHPTTLRSAAYENRETTTGWSVKEIRDN